MSGHSIPLPKPPGASPTPPPKPPPKPGNSPLPPVPSKSSKKNAPPPVIPQKPVVPHKPGTPTPPPSRPSSTEVPLPKAPSPRAATGSAPSTLRPSRSNRKSAKFKNKLFSTFRSGSSADLRDDLTKPPSNPEPPASPKSKLPSVGLVTSSPSISRHSGPAVTTEHAAISVPTPPAPAPRTPSRTKSANSLPKLAPRGAPKAVAITNKPATPDSELSELDLKRKKIVQEILQTEDTYVKVLDDLLNGYQRPLIAKAETDELPNVTKAQMRSVFSNIEQLLPMNQHLLSEIQARVNSWHATQLIGDIFEKTGPFFKIYNMYGNNYDRGQAVLDKCMTDPTFVSTIEALESQVKNLRLPNLLIQPIQRIPRYNLLLRDLLAKTDASHPDHEYLSAGLETLESVMNYLDANITQAENTEKILKFSSVKGADALVKPHRQLVQEFSLNIREHDTQATLNGLKKKLKTRGLFKDIKLNIWLFNDVLVHLTNQKSKKKTNIASTKYTWPLELVWIKDIPEIEPTDTKLPYSLLLVGPRQTYTLRFPDPGEKKKWTEVFTNAIASCLTEENAPDAKQMVRYGTYEFPDKDRGCYTGWWKFGKIHGQGVYQFHGSRYTGKFQYNSKSGNGTMELASGEIYQGEWKDDVPHGYGILTYPNKDRYEGCWEEGLRCGYGTHYYANGDKYEGDWKENVPHGEGHYCTKTGFEYHGSYRSAVYHGDGYMRMPNGRVYEGEFREGLRHGEGRMNWNNGRYYMGQWNSGKMHGKGLLMCHVEGSYLGDFREGFKEGQGVMNYRNGDMYSGGWKRNNYQGHGTITCATGGIVSYEGGWDNGLKHGKGVLVYRDGSKYEGHFREDLPHGHGVHTVMGSVSLDGKWEEAQTSGKLSISVGQSKLSAQCHNALVDEGKIHSFVVFTQPPVVHLSL